MNYPGPGGGWGLGVPPSDICNIRPPLMAPAWKRKGNTEKSVAQPRDGHASFRPVGA